MRQMRFILPIALVFVLLPTIVRADITYDVNLSIGSTGTATGFIVTDGTTGTLSQSDFLDWDLLLTVGASSIDLLGPLEPGANSFVQALGSDVSATTTQLLFNFSGGDGGYLFFESNGGTHFLCFGPYTPVCGGQSGIVESVKVPPEDLQYTALTGTQVIGTTAVAGVPEPSALLLLSSGLAGLAGLVRRRR